VDSTILADSLALRAARFVAAGFGSGWLPKAPGTWGSLASLLPGWLLLYFTGLFGLACGIIVVSLLGFLVCAKVLPTLKNQDPGWIVIDEWAGQWLCLLICAPFLSVASWLLVVAAFVLFRLFDILKPWPIRPLEHWGSPWWSIMVDDLAAGALGGALMAAAAGIIGLLAGGST
jgi:phosphatidylglycerophosphatase A